jgi:short-subunit dehydrogenase
MISYKDKTIWITGASSGTGEALTYAFAKEGGKLIISARRREALERVRANCPQPERVFVLPLDLEDHQSLPEKAKQAAEHFGGIDLLFNNGGISQRSLAKDTLTVVDKRLMDINYMGPVILTKSVLPYMTEQKHGQIAVMSSLAGKFGIPYRTAYAASKHALHGFFDSLRPEVHEYNIGITLIASGYIRTSIAKNAFNESGKPAQKNDAGIENGMSPEYFANMALRALKQGRHELLLGGKERMGVYLKRFAPGLLAKLLRKQL